MNSSMTFTKTFLTVLVGVACAGFAGVTSAQSSQPSAKATFAASNLVTLPANTWTPILTQKIKMANQKDLFISPSLQCGIVTDTTVKSVNGSLDSEEARGTVRVRVTVTGPDGKSVVVAPVSGVDATNTVQSAGEGIVYCDRVQQLKAKFSGLNCTADSYNGYAVTCTDPEELQLILKTLNANAFNFVAANTSSGVHTVKVEAYTTAYGTSEGIDGVLNQSNAFIGAGSVAIESVRMIKGEDIYALD